MKTAAHWQHWRTWLPIAGFLLVMNASAFGAWRMEIQDKTALTNQTGVTLDITYAWDVGIVQATLPLIVRSIDPGSFWAGSLPYDTTDIDGNHLVNGVSWNSIVPPWASFIYEVRPGPYGGPEQHCQTDADTNHYNGVSPDHFVISTQGISALAARPDGVVFVTLTFNITGTPGQFEFDTACLNTSLNTIIIADAAYPPVDHGPEGTNEVVFKKGIVTIQAGGILSGEEEIPAAYSLGQNYPNPFNANTLIEFSLRETKPVKLEVFNILGQRVAVPVDEILAAGIHTASWNGRDADGRSVGSGMYFYRLTAGEFTQMKKMVLMK